MSPEKSVTGEFVVGIEEGLHLRSAASLAKVANQYQSEITIRHGDVSTSARSVLGLLSLCAPQGAKLEVACEGTDAREAFDAVGDLFRSGFQEGDRGRQP